MTYESYRFVAAEQQLVDLTDERLAMRVSVDRSAGSDLEPGDPAALAAEVRALRHELQLRDMFISTAAHELRNPLSPAYMQLEHMKEIIRSETKPISQTWLLSQLSSVTARFDRFLVTLTRLLDVSRLSDGHVLLLPEPCDLGEIVTTVLAAHGPELRASRCSVALDVAAPVTGMWDPMRLEQIVGNLLSNAGRYGAGNPISVEVSGTPATARLVVRDRGIGIAAEDLTRIFQRFERAGNVGRNAGFGLGLWIVNQLCNAMGGTVDVESQLDCGTTFTVNLPRLPS